MTAAPFTSALRSVLAGILVSSGISAAAQAEPGAAATRIVLPEPATAVDRFAVQELGDVIKASSGVACRTVSAADAAGGGRRIFVGLNLPRPPGLVPDRSQRLGLVLPEHIHRGDSAAVRQP